MSSLQALLILLTFVIDSYKCLNTFTKKIGTNGEDIWKSTSDFIPQQSQSFGTIQIGEIMSAEFDFVFNGRSNSESAGFEENFFRVGRDATDDRYCAGQEMKYPSFWLKYSTNHMIVKVTSGSICTEQQSLSDYGLIYKGTSYHIKISFNASLLTVQVTDNDNPTNGGWPNADWSQTWTRDPTEKTYIGAVVPVWWMSNKYSTSKYNIGNGTFSNITIKSLIHTWTPTYYPTIYPTNNPTIIPTISTNNPTISPTNNPSTTPTKYPTNNPTHIPTNNPSITPTYIPTISPITSNITTSPTITTVSPSHIPTNTPSISPTDIPTHIPTISPITPSPTNTPTITPTSNTLSPSHIPTTNPTIYPTNYPTYIPTNIPTIYPSSNPTSLPTNNPTIVPTTQPTLLPSYNPTLQPSKASDFPTINPTTLPTYTSVSPTILPSLSPTRSTTKRPTFGWFPYTTTTQHPIVVDIDDNEPIHNNNKNDMQSYEKIEITIFASVVSLCFCTVFCFLAYLMFKRRLNHLQRKKNLKPPDYDYKLELAPKQTSIIPAYSDSIMHLTHTNTKNINGTLKPTHLNHIVQSKSSNTNTMHLQSPHRNTQRYDQSLTSEQLAYDLGAYKDDSLPNSKSSIHLKDCTPTPTVSPNNNHKNTLHKRYKSDILDVMDDMDDMDVEEIDIDPNNLLVKYRKPPKVKKKKKKYNYTTETAPTNYTMDTHEIEPYEEVLDGYVDGIYTHNLNNNYEGEYNETKRIFSSGGNGYTWIRQTLERVDSQYHDEYLGNFHKHKVKDHRLADLLPEDWKELIPAIGPRNDFKRIWKMKYANSQKHTGNGSNDSNGNYGAYDTGEFEYYDEDLDTNNTMPHSHSPDNHYYQSEYTDDMPQELQSELLSALNSEMNEEVLTEIQVKCEDLNHNNNRFLSVDSDMADSNHNNNNNRFLSVDSENIDTPTTQFDDEEDSDETTSEDDDDDDEEELPHRRVEYGKHDDNGYDHDHDNDNEKQSVFSVSVSVSTPEHEDEHDENETLTFEDLRNKYGGKNKSKKKDKQSILSALSSAVSVESALSNDTQSTMTESYYDSSNLSEEEYKYKHRNKKNFIDKDLLPSPISEEPEEFDDDFDDFESEKVVSYETYDNDVHKSHMNPHVHTHTNNAMISPGFSGSHQYNIGHQIYAKPALKSVHNSSMSSSSGMSLQSADSQDSQVSGRSDTTLSVPQPNEADVEELLKPLEDDSSEDEDTIGIPKFEAEIDSDEDEEDDEFEDDDDEDEDDEEEEFEDEEYDENEQQEYHHEYNDEFNGDYDENYNENYEEEYEEEYEDEYEDEYGDEEAVIDIGLSESEHDEEYRD